MAKAAAADFRTFRGPLDLGPFDEESGYIVVREQATRREASAHVLELARSSLALVDRLPSRSAYRLGILVATAVSSLEDTEPGDALGASESH